MTNGDGGDQRKSLLHHDPHQYNPPDDDSPSLQHATANYGSAASDAAAADNAHKKDTYEDEDEDGSTSSSRTVVPLELLRMVPLWNMAAILSTAFAYGCIMTTLFLITLPIECERIHDESVVRNRSSGSGSTSTVTPKSVALGVFVAIAGFTQLVSPLVGRLSDTYQPPRSTNDVIQKSKHSGKNGAPDAQNEQQQDEELFEYAEIGQRMPYYSLGGILSVVGLLGQMFSSSAQLWIRYGFAFFFSMVGLNIQYSMMIALIPDQIPHAQTGVANGVLALLLVMGSLFGFGLFHTFLSQTIGSMYGLYTCIVIATSILTGTHAHERDAELTAERISKRRGGTAAAAVRSGFDRNNSDEGSHCSIISAGSPLPHHHHHHRLHHKWPRSAKKAVKKAVRKAHEMVLTPTLLVKSMLDPLSQLSWSAVLSCYTIDVHKHHDFFVVTVSRLFYYCGMSVQTFFLYFVHDIIGVRTNPEVAVATLAILGQCAGALTCYPVGLASDYLLGGRRTPFVYVACFVLGTATLTLVLATTFKQMVVFCLILGAANGVYLTMETSMAVDTLPRDLVDGEDDGDESGNAQLLGIWGVAAFLGSALGPMIGGPLLYIFGTSNANPSQAGEDGAVSEEYTLTGYAVVLGLSAVYFFCSAFTLQFIKYHHE